MAEEKWDYDALKAHYDGVIASLTTLQTKLDEALQKHVDDKAAQEKALAGLREQSVIEAKRYAQEYDALIDQHALTLEKQAADLAAQHAQAVAKLKTEVLIPAQRDLHARQMADLQAKHEAELNALTK